MARRLLLVAFFIEVGLLLIVLPWSAFWEGNYFAAAWPALRPVVANNFVRGAITGLGVVNLVMGFIDLGPLIGWGRPSGASSTRRDLADTSPLAAQPGAQVDP